MIRPSSALLALSVNIGFLAQAEPVPLLDLPGSGTDPEAIDYASLPVLEGEHAVINPAAKSPDFAEGEKLEMNRMRLQLHNYLIHHEGRFWCLWSDGPKIEDWPTQEVKYATSEDGLNWTEAKSVTGTPDEPYAYIARGLWLRQGTLLALVAHYQGQGAFGSDKDLELQAFAWNPESEKWQFESVVFEDAINNFPPQRLPDGDWIMTRRDSRFNVSMLIGGRESLDEWTVHPVVAVAQVEGFRPDEPVFWIEPDGLIRGLFRDNGGSQRLFHSISADGGKNWEPPTLTNFPNSTSKLFPLATSRGYRILVSNANPQIARRELHVSATLDGETFTTMAKLDIPSPPMPQGFEPMAKKFSQGIVSLQYPHVIEHDGALWIAFSRGKVQTEIFRIPLDSIDAILP